MTQNNQQDPQRGRHHEEFVAPAMRDRLDGWPPAVEQHWPQQDATARPNAPTWPEEGPQRQPWPRRSSPQRPTARRGTPAWAAPTPIPVSTPLAAPPEGTAPPVQTPPRELTYEEKLQEAFNAATVWPGLRTDPGEMELTWGDIRRQVAHRSKQVNSVQCFQTYEREGTAGALSPYALLLFFVNPDADEPNGYKIRFLVRMFLAGPESERLTKILSDVTRSVESNLHRATEVKRRWHPRGPEGSIVNAGEMDMPTSAVYLGCGVSTLDTDELKWHEAVQAIKNQRPQERVRERGVFDLAGQSIITLVDGTDMKVIRDPHRRLNSPEIASNRNLDPDRLSYWNANMPIRTMGDPDLRGAWSQLETLNKILHAYLNAPSAEPRR
jgi:hypothetical protein